MSLPNISSPDTDVSTALARRGITRRQLVKFCSAMLGTLALPERYLAQVVQAVGKAKKPVLVWLQFQDCTGCSESMLRSSHPDVAEVVLDLLSWEYHEVIMAGAGKAAERGAGSRRERRQRQIPGGGGRRDPHRRGLLQHRRPQRHGNRRTRSAATPRPPSRWAPAPSTAAWCARHPNPTGALGVHEAVPGIKVMNMAGCPHNPANTAAALVHYPDVQRSARARSIQPAAVRLWPHHSRSMRAPRALRCRPLRHRMGRRRASQRLVPLQDGLQGSGGDLQLPGGAAGTTIPVGRSAPATAASPALRRASGTTCRRSTTGCRRCPDSASK